MLWPREAAKFISERAKDVEVNPEGVTVVGKLMAEHIMKTNLKMEDFLQNELSPNDRGLSDEDLVNWQFVIDTINFNFWTPDGEPKYTVIHREKELLGYLGMVNAVNRAIDEGKKIYDPKYYSKLYLDDLKHIFRSDNGVEMPMLNERVKVLADVSKVLVEKYNGCFSNVIKKADHSAMKLVEIVTEDFECYRDVAEYGGQQIAFYKRAQILVSDLWTLFGGKNYGHFKDLDQLTIFADYRIPQVLKYFGALKYTPSLMEKLKKEQVFQNGCREEVEIRGCSIHAMELALKETKEFLTNLGGDPTSVNVIMLDYFFWDYRYRNAKKVDETPYHRVRCIYY